MTLIRRLPPALVNQIAAGEVIERPASVAKELIENAIDAGARRIAVTVEAGGRGLVRVTDDGRGIASTELALALAPHATSKIGAQADLDAIATMGFRGEALASIASVSRLTLLSRPREQESAYAIDSEGGAETEPRPAAGPVGTTVSVRSLFFNTPARRKFLKTDQTEATRVSEIVQKIALAHPSIAFSVTVDGRERFDAPPDQAPRDRVLTVVGRELADELLEVSSPGAGGGSGGIGIWGLAGLPSIARTTSRHQRVYVNGRSIVDRTIAHAIKEAYRGLIEPTRTPTIVLFLEMDPTSVDVNVHPTKAEVRFRHQGHVHGSVLGAVREALRAADLTPAFDLEKGGNPRFSEKWGLPPSSAPGAIVDCFRRLGAQEKGFVYSEVKAALAREAPELLDAPAAAGPPDEAASMPTVRAAQDVLQVHSSYLVTQDEAGMLIIDQHALHERVMFETLRERVESGALESQRLLMPAVVPVDDRQIEALAELAPLLARLGIEAEPMGPKTVAVHAFTSLLFERGVDPVTFMQELLARTVDQERDPGTEAALHEVLDMMACKAAIKAGDRLDPHEIRALLDRRESVERSSNCPHGRPTTLRLSLRDLERRFGRK